MEHAEFSIRYEVGDNEIELESFITSLQGFKEAIQRIANYYHGAPIKIKVKATAQGSFLVELSLYLADHYHQVKDLFSSDIKLTSAVLSSLSHSINLTKFLRGKKPRKTQEMADGIHTKIENNNGNVYTIKTETFNLIVGADTFTPLTQALNVIDTNPSIEGVELLDEKGEVMADVNKDEIKDIISSPPVELDEKRIVIKDNVTLFATKLSWDPNIKWSFIYKGNKITAKIVDPLFYKGIEEGERFAKGDQFVVRLEIVQHFDKGANTFINKKYRVLKILKHIPRAQQGDIQF